jgi:hypothetical protein
VPLSARAQPALAEPAALSPARASEQPAWALTAHEAEDPRVATFSRRLRIHAAAFSAGVALLAGGLGTALGNEALFSTDAAAQRRADRGWRVLMVSGLPLAFGLGGMISAALRRRHAQADSGRVAWGAMASRGGGRVGVAVAF